MGAEGAMADLEPKAHVVEENAVVDAGEMGHETNITRKRGGSRGGSRPQFTLQALSVQQDISCILDYLYLGAKGCSQDLESLKGLGIEYIVNCTQDVPNVHQGCGVEYLQVPVGDAITEPIGDYFDDAIQFIDAAKKGNSKVLVHCTLGMSRSATVVLAYLVKGNGMSLAKALELTKDKRPVSSPNVGFMQQLVQLEERVTGHPSTISIERYSANRFGSVEEVSALPREEVAAGNEDAC